MVDLEAIRVKAFRSVVKPDYAGSLRRIFRWYSKQFSTPLHEVEDLPLEFVLQNYFEDHYSNMEEVEIQEELQELSLTPAERIELESANDHSDDAFEAAILADIAAAQKAAAAAKDVSLKFDDDTGNLGEWGDLNPLAPPPKKR